MHKLVEKYQAEFASHPCELLDILCVADCATLPLGKTLLFGPSLTKDEVKELADLEAPALISTMYVIHDEDSRISDDTGAILAGLIHDLTQRIAFEDTSIRDWADHLAYLGWYGGIGRPIYWTADDLSPEVQAKLQSNGPDEDGWSKRRKHLP